MNRGEVEGVYEIVDNSMRGRPPAEPEGSLKLPSLNVPPAQFLPAACPEAEEVTVYDVIPGDQ